MKRHFHALLFALRHIGLPGWAGAMLALSSLAYAAIIVPQQQAELHGASVEAARLQQRRMAMEKAPGAASDANAQAKSAAELPTVKSTPEALLNLEDIARKNKLRPKRNDYRYVDRIPPASGKQAAPVPRRDAVVEVRIAMPTSGKYSDVRAFIAHAMERLPTLALEGMSLSRETIAQSDIQAQLRFTLFVRRD